MTTSLSQSINKISEVDRKVSQFDKKELDNEFIDNMRFMISSLSQSIDKGLIIKRLIIKYHKLIKKNKKINLLIT